MKTSRQQVENYNITQKCLVSQTPINSHLKKMDDLQNQSLKFTKNGKKGKLSHLIMLQLRQMVQLLHCETSCYKSPCDGFTDLGSIPGHDKIMNVLVFHQEGNMVL